MNTIIAIGAVHAFYLAFLVFTKKKKELHDIILTVLLLLLAGVFGLVFLSFEWDMLFLQIFLWNFSLLSTPVFFIYASSLMSENSRFRFSWFWHFLPYIISTIYLFYLLITLPKIEIGKLFVNQNLFSGPMFFTFFSILELIVIPFYMVWIFILLQKHQHKITDTFSKLEGRDLKWLKILTFVLLGLGLVINGFVFLGTSAGNLSDENSILYGFSFAVFFIFYMGYFGIKQAAVFGAITQNRNRQATPKVIQSIFPEPILLQKKYKKSSLKVDDAEAYSEKLLQYMEQKKPYLQNDLTIHDIANALNISYHHLSQVLNESHQKTFFDFVNQYRVDEFKKRIKIGDDKNFTLLAIALDCGFNSKSSFNRVFKKVTNHTPREFAKNLK